MEKQNEIENIIGSIDFYKSNAYDRLIETLTANLETMEKAEILKVFNEFIQSLKSQNREMVGQIYKANNKDLALAYAYTTKSHIANVDRNIDQILIQNNQKHNQEITSENSLPGNIIL